MNQALTCREVINYKAFPIDQPDSLKRAQIIDRVRKELVNDGCAVIQNFISDVGLQTLLAEALARKDQAFYSPKKNYNVYLGEGAPDLPDDHPRNTFLPRSNGFITADLFGKETNAYRLYHWEPLREFLAECLGKKQLFIYQDPVSNMIVNLGKPGQQFNWHYDTNEFTITMLLKAASAGGLFEYVPGLRNPQDECYDEVKKVLDGDRSRVTQLQLNAGDLQFFQGRFSLHQVTRNTGNQDRLLLIMSFTEKPDMIGSMVRTRDLYGKVTEAHLQNESNRVRADDLLD